MNYTLVTGASGVLGKCFCKRLAGQGNNLIITGRSQRNLDLLKDELNLSKVDIIAISCNMQNQQEREELFN